MNGDVGSACVVLFSASGIFSFGPTLGEDVAADDERFQMPPGPLYDVILAVFVLSAIAPTRHAGPRPSFWPGHTGRTLHFLSLLLTTHFSFFMRASRRCSGSPWTDP